MEKLLKSDMQKKLVMVGLLNRIITPVFFILIFVVFSCGNRNNSLQENASDSTELKSKVQDSKDQNDTTLHFAGTQYADTAAFFKKEYNSIEPLIGKLGSAKIESCIAKVDRYQRLFSQDSVLDVYKINVCNQQLSCEILFGKNNNQRKFYLDGKSLSKKAVKSFNSFIPDSLNLQVQYASSHYYKIDAKSNFVLIVSKSEQWTGEMSNYNFLQLVDLNSLVIYELIHS